jgi:hypothetical protein
MRTFYGPFLIKEARDAYLASLKEKEEKRHKASFVAETDGRLSHEEAEQYRDTINPNRTKYLVYDGPIPDGLWVKLPTEDKSVFLYYKEEEAMKLLKSDARRRGF